MHRAGTNTAATAKAWILTLASAFALSAGLACSSAPHTGFASDGTDPTRGGGGSSGGDTATDGSAGGTSSGTNPGGGSSGGTTSGGGGGSSSGAGSSGAGSSGTSSGAKTDAGSPGHGIVWGSIPAADEGQTVTLTATPFQVLPGQEVFKCEVFPNPFGGVATDILSMHGKMSIGSHHFFLFNMSALEAASEPKGMGGQVNVLGDCAGNGIEFHPFPFLSQQPDWTVNFPTDTSGAPMGYPLVGQNLLMINVHYLNTGATTINANVSIDITPAKPGVVKTHVGTIFLNQTTMSVPASATMQAPYDASMIWGGDPGIMPASYSIFTSWSHMHRWGMKFTASTGGKAFYTETNWDSPNLYIHAPNMPEPTTATGPTAPIQMNGNPAITWDCQYYNDTGMTLGFGDSALTNVMCIYLGQYYPASATNPDDIAVLN